MHIWIYASELVLYLVYRIIISAIILSVVIPAKAIIYISQSVRHCYCRFHCD